MNGLAYIHGQNKMHRDIKPANILLRNNTVTTESTDKMSAADTNVLDFQIKLADFGLCRTLGPESMATAGVGTPGYIAPEVLNGDAYTMTCDNYSVGITVAQLYFGNQIPWTKDKIRTYVMYG